MTKQNAAHDEPASMLDGLTELRRRARAARHAYWFPLVLFGLLTLAPLPLYVAPPPCQSPCDLTGPDSILDVSLLGPFLVLGGIDTPHRAALAAYWLLALVGGYLLTVRWYRWRGQKVGLHTRMTAYLATGMVTLVVFSVASIFGPLSLLHNGGTGAYLVIAAGLVTLARLERSRGLAVIAVSYTAVALLVDLYDVENLVYRLGWTGWNVDYRYGAFPNVTLAAVVLLAGGAAALAVDRAAVRRLAADSNSDVGNVETGQTRA